MRAEWDRFFDERYFTRWHPRDDPETTAAEAAGAMALAEAEDGARILDAACGFGRHAIALARLGFSVTGVDRSAALLAHARDLTRDVERQPRWVETDYTSLPFADGSFDVVISMNSSLGFDEGADDERALREFGRVLVPGGRLLIETNHTGRLATEVREREEEPFGGDGAVLTIDRHYEPGTGVIRVLHTVEREGRKETIDMSRRLYAADELEQMLGAAGFHSPRRFGDLQGGAFGGASRLVLVAAA